MNIKINLKAKTMSDIVNALKEITTDAENGRTGGVILTAGVTGMWAVGGAEAKKKEDVPS